jgi:protein required for attachment to host cells
MRTTWILAADESRARVLQARGPKQELVEVNRLENPEGRLHQRDMLAGPEPRFDGHGGVGRPAARSTGGVASDREPDRPTEQSAQRFARELGCYLDKAHGEQAYDELVLIAPPKFLGALRKELSGEVEKLVADEIPKDLSWLDPRDIERHIRPH